MTIFFTIIACFFYLFASFKVIPGIMNAARIPVKIIFGYVCIALISHFILLHNEIMRQSGQNLSMLNVASLISFLIAALTTGANLRFRLWFLLPIVYIFCALNLFALAVIPEHFVTTVSLQAGLLVHITLALFSYSIAMIAALYAIQFSWLDHKLKNKTYDITNHNVPPLLVIEKQLYSLMSTAFVLLSLTLISAFVLLDHLWQSPNAHKMVLSIIVWISSLVLLIGHYKYNWRGRVIVWGTLINGILLTIAYFGSRFAKEVIFH